MHMHTLGWGRYKWRLAPAEAEGEGEAGAEGEGEAGAEGEGAMGPSRSSRSSHHGGGEGGWFVAEVKVQPTDLVTQYGTFVEEREEERGQSVEGGEAQELQQKGEAEPATEEVVERLWDS